jgi:hypothetical protein
MHEHTKDYKSKKRNLKMNENNLNIKYIPVVRSKSRWSILKFSMIKFYNNLLFILVMVLSFYLARSCSRATPPLSTPGGQKEGFRGLKPPHLSPARLSDSMGIQGGNAFVNEMLRNLVR